MEARSGQPGASQLRPVVPQQVANSTHPPHHQDELAWRAGHRSL